MLCFGRISKGLTRQIGDRARRVDAITADPAASSLPREELSSS